MKLLLEVALAVVAGFIHGDRLGLRWQLWKDNDPNGVDIKFRCHGSVCGSLCPEGYSRIHCATFKRCVYRFGSQNNIPNSLQKGMPTAAKLPSR
ncbi:hypothetical protein EV426DRAFT_626105 [Tirmania nivea]|nr:hypothetical protein EV426DRAFT_626105 [Tirmania nivea]